MHKLIISTVILLFSISTSVLAEENIAHLTMLENFKYKPEQTTYTDEEIFQKDILSAQQMNHSNSQLRQVAFPKTQIFPTRTNSALYQPRYEPEKEILSIENVLERNLQ